MVDTQADDILNSVDKEDASLLVVGDLFGRVLHPFTYAHTIVLTCITVQ